jgi:heat shock protein HslJ
MRNAWLLVPLAAVVVAAGAGAAPASPLTASGWTLSTLLGKPPLAKTELSAEFTTAGTVSGSAGCNRYGGRYTSSGSALKMSTFASTQMACATKIMAQESVFLKMLASVRSYAISGTTLTLRSAAGRTLATFKSQSQALAGTSWNVTAYNNGKQAVVSALASPTLTAAFGKDGNLTGFAGCNAYDAPYKATAPKLSIGPVAATRKECASPAGVMTQEHAYLAALHTAATYRIDGSRLELRTATGAIAAEFARR